MAYQKESLYAIKNESGQWFRKGRYGFVDDFSKARIYTKIGQARSIVTRYSGQVPCHLVKLVISEQVDVYERDRIEKIKQKELLRRLNWDKKQKEQQLESAKRDFERAKEQLEKLTNNNLGVNNG